jgi:hypothetical protein
MVRSLSCVTWKKVDVSFNYGYLIKFQAHSFVQVCLILPLLLCISNIFIFDIINILLFIFSTHAILPVKYKSKHIKGVNVINLPKSSRKKFLFTLRTFLSRLFFLFFQATIFLQTDIYIYSRLLSLK